MKPVCIEYDENKEKVAAEKEAAKLAKRAQKRTEFPLIPEYRRLGLTQSTDHRDSDAWKEKQMTMQQLESMCTCLNLNEE